jgi:hypothetical protein
MFTLAYSISIGEDLTFILKTAVFPVVSLKSSLDTEWSKVASNDSSVIWGRLLGA